MTDLQRKTQRKITLGSEQIFLALCVETLPPEV
jgi:hypothetical protein